MRFVNHRRTDQCAHSQTKGEKKRYIDKGRERATDRQKKGDKDRHTYRKRERKSDIQTN